MPSPREMSIRANRYVEVRLHFKRMPAALHVTDALVVVVGLVAVAVAVAEVGAKSGVAGFVSTFVSVLTTAEGTRREFPLRGAGDAGGVSTADEEDADFSIGPTSPAGGRMRERG